MIPDRFPRNSIDTKATVPPGDFFLPNSIKNDRAEEEFLQRVEQLGRQDALVITHDDADGLTSGIYMKDWFESVTGHSAVVQPTSYRGACDLPTSLKLLNDEVAVRPGWVFVTDLGASLFEAAQSEIKALYPDTEVGWIDHHQWSDEQLSELRQCAHSVIDDSACATQLISELRDGAHDVRFPLESDGMPVEQSDLATVVNDHDIWIKEDPRSDRVAIFAEYADDAEYMSAALTGIEMLNEYDETIAAYEEENNALLDRLVETAVERDVGGLDVAIAYGYGPSASAGNDLVEEHGHELAVVMRPDGSVSFYAHSSEEEFTECHVVAEQLGGGGHPTAAGAGLSLEAFEEYVELWERQNRPGENPYVATIEEAISTVVTETPSA